MNEMRYGGDGAVVFEMEISWPVALTGRGDINFRECFLDVKF